MTLTPLSSREHRTPVPASPRTRRSLARRRHATTVAASTLGASTVDAATVRAHAVGAQPEVAALTVSFDVTLAGESRYAEALRLLDTLRQATAHLATATLDVTPGVGLPVAEGPAETYPVASGRTPLAGSDGYIEIRPESRGVAVAGAQIPLTRVEFDLLLFLAEHPGRVFGRSQLLASVWGYEHAGRRTVDVHIRRLRVKLGDRLVTTVRGVGYRLADDARVRVVRLDSPI